MFRDMKRPLAILPLMLAAAFWGGLPGPMAARAAEHSGVTPAPGEPEGRAPADDKGGNLGRGMDMLSEGTQLLLRGLMDELGPILEDMKEKADDLNAYYPPEVLPNGDIIIRRKVPLVPEDPIIDGEGEVEL